MNDLTKLEDLFTRENKSSIDIVTSSLMDKHDIHLTDNIDSDSQKYLDLLKFLDDVPDNDVIYLHLANFGGDCHVGFRISHALKQCKATVVVLVEGPCYSMGSIIALAGDFLKLNPHTFLMFHNYSTSEFGKAGEVHSAIQEYDKHFISTFQHFCSPFLTANEINKIKRDGDLYIHESDATIVTRMERHFDKYIELSEALQLTK